ncbi:craniofacial development protein 2-like [Papilio machaon]|uniref:craniofacial development protein 2-like n=1 Tax=Papilio machaon TaxID=76193 RepID=UPI001E6654CE|nr:craniofacial development protein 2-like [Papilio machaon]
MGKTINSNNTSEIQIATLNTRSLRTSEKLIELEIALEEIKWDILGLSELRRFGDGIVDCGKYILHYKGETPGLYGVGFMIKKKYAKNIVEIKGVSERIALLNIKLPLNKGKDETWSIIQAYSPTESDKKEDIAKIENFYKDLQTTIDSCYKNIIVMGDFNGQIGECQTGENYTIGKFGFGSRSNNGSRLISFALENKLSILNSFYNKKKAKKWTWMSPNGLYKNEIDFILSNKRNVFKDVTTLNNFNFNTDHKMVRGTLTANYRKSRKFQNKYIPVANASNNDMLLNNITSALKNIDKVSNSVQEKYNYLLKALTTETKRTNLETKRSISCEAKKLLEERKILLSKEKDKETRKKISELSKKINEQIRKDRKTKRTRNLQKHIEKTGGIKKAIKELDAQKEWMPSAKSKEGKYCTGRSEIIKIATDYYKNLYKCQHNTLEPTNNILLEENEIIPKILKEETHRWALTR